MKKWTRGELTEVFRSIVFRAYKTRVENFEKTKSGEFDIVRCANWVNVVALTTDNKMILVRQYRAGLDDITIETPAGGINFNEEPLLAAKRELEEETGYVSSEWSSLGYVDVNPAFMTNKCFFFLAKNCRNVDIQNFDPLEEIEIDLKDISDVKEMMSAQKITHSLTLISLYRFFSC